MTAPGFPNREARGFAGAKNGARRGCLGSKEAAPELVAPRHRLVVPAGGLRPSRPEMPPGARRSRHRPGQISSV